MIKESSYRYYVLSLLTIVAAFAYIDRQLIIILQESIKEELGLTDTQLGFASGLAFTIMYVTLSIPVAYLADRFNRKNIIALALAVWSGITALTGLASNFGSWNILAEIQEFD